jgi:cysteine synthase B
MRLAFVRSRLLRSVADQVGQTPLLRLERIGKTAPSVEIYAKLEFANPGGSVKDRPALSMMLAAIENGSLTSGKTLLDSTSGNTGVAYALYGAALGYPVELVMPSNVTKARKDIVQAFGAKIVYSDPMEGSDGAIRVAQKMIDEGADRYFYPNQYANPANPGSHYHGTAREILDALGDRITHFVAGLGTTGTMMGTARRLREHHRPVRCVAVEPDHALHGLEGLKHLPSSIVPAIYDAALTDETMRVSTEDGWNMADRLAAEEGLHIGHSSGANVFAALKIAEELHTRQGGGCVVTIIADRGDRYFAPMKWEKRYAW